MTRRSASTESWPLGILVGGGLAAVSLGVWVLWKDEAREGHKGLGRWKRRHHPLSSAGLASTEDLTIGLAVDVGSSSIRCSAYVLHRTGEVTPLPDSMVQVKREVVNASGTGNTEEILGDIDVVVDGCLRYLRRYDLARAVKAVGFAEFAMNLVGIDEAGRCVTPLLTYADHHPGTAAAALRLRRRLKDSQQLEALYSLTGAPIHVGYAPAQLWRLAEEAPAAMSRVSCWQTLAGRALSRWTGKRVVPMSYSEASWTGMLDYRRLAWCKELLLPLLPCLKGGATLPPLADYCETDELGHVTGHYAERWPELASARLFLGVGDGACANLGSGCCDDTLLAATIGTSAAARIVIQCTGGAGQEQHQQQQEDVKVPFGLWCYRIDRHRLLLGGALTDGGSVIKWLEDSFGITAGPLTEAKASLLGPDSHGLTMLPFPSGERAPGWNLEATAAMVGLTRATTREQVYRAALEAVALRLGSIIKLMGDCVSPEVEVSVSGTGLQASPLWRQILADITNRKVVLGQGSEATSAGVALLMCEALFNVRRGSSVDPQCTHTPSAEAHAAYRSAMRRQNGLYDVLCNDSHWKAKSAAS